MTPSRVPVVLAAWATTVWLSAAATVFPGQDWEMATPESQGMDSAKLEQAVNFLKANAGSNGVQELVVVRNGRMLWRGDNVDHRHGVWSCTKSFTSTVLGLLVEDGKCTLDTPAASVLPELKEHYPDVTLRHFTTMTSGYRAVGDETKGSYTHGPSNTPFEPNPRPLFTPPGSRYAYWDSAMNVFGLVLTRIAGEPLEELFRRRIALPIGMKNWDWGNYATNNGIVVNGGSGNGNKHMFISAREMARFGLLYLNKGNWNGQQLMSEKWTTDATRVHVPADLPWAHTASGIDGRGCYGFNWWVNGVTASGKRLWPGAPKGAFAALGHNNNKCTVIPEWNMVVVRLGLDQNDRKITDATWSGFLDRLGDALLETRVSIEDGQWHLNGRVTYPGARAEGLLMNIRMVNATFEDRNKPDFDAEANADEFIARIPDYVAHGVRAFTLCLQGGMPGYEGAVNSAFNPDGSLRDEYLRRVRRVIEACDRNGAAVILGLYYQRQSKILRDADAIRAGVANEALWVQSSGFKNVALEIANEYPHGGFVHPILKTPEGEAELIRLAKATAPGLLVSASGYGDGKLHDAVAEASDFLLIHFNGLKLEQIAPRIEALRRFRKPIVCNEDDRSLGDFPTAAEIAVTNGCSHGLMLRDHNQRFPFTFLGAADAPAVYAKYRKLTSVVSGQSDFKPSDTSDSAAVVPPYPPSPVIAAIEWAPKESIVRRGKDGDNWPLTWADDDALYTTWGDGTGFEPKVEKKLSCGFARVAGSPDNFTGVNIRSSAEQLGQGRAGKKGWGILCIEGTLYLWFGHADNRGATMQLAWSRDHAKTWTFADWKFAEFGMIGFVNFGKDCAGARDEFVYAYSHDDPHADTPADRFVLMRAPKNRLNERAAWEFLSKLNSSDQPIWTRDIAKRGAVFQHPSACLRSAMTYCAPLKRYLWWQHIPQPPGVTNDRGDTRFTGGFGVYDAPEPWGPWSTAFFTSQWDVGPGEHGDFPAKWMSADGKTLHLVFSGDDSFSVRRATVVLWK